MKSKITKKSMLSLIFILIISMLSLSTYKVSAGSNYIITNKQDFINYLLNADADMDGSYTLTTDLDFTKGSVVYNGITYQLDKESLTINPIGEKKNNEGKILSSYYNPFKGTFNGQNHVIKGLNIKSLAEDNEYVGLFGYNQGIISNIGLVDSNVNGGVHVGGIAGYNMGIIMGTYNTSSITGIGTVGGITGINYGYIRNSYNTGYVGGATKVGGIVGHNGSVISAVYDLGIISGEVTDDGKKEYGYIFGYNNAQGVIGYVEDNNGSYSFYNPSQKYSKAGAYYSNEYDIGVGYNLGYLAGEETLYDNVNLVSKSLTELQDLNTYDSGFKEVKSNIRPIGSNLIHQTTGFYIRRNSNYKFPVVGTSEFTSKEHVENSLNKNGFTGSGTIYNPYLIKNENDLKNINKSLTSAYKIVNSINLNTSFNPIGSEDRPFLGILNGNGKRITNLVIESSEELEYVGLFAFNSGIIHNLSLDVSINVPLSSKVGGIAGFNNGQIYESYVMGDIIGQTTVGGIVGSNELGSLKNLYNKANITANFDLGGIAGYNSGIIDFVYNPLDLNYINSNVGQNLGSIVGYNENSHNLNNIKNAIYYNNPQIGYQTSTYGPYNNLDNKVNNLDDFFEVFTYSNFSIEKVNSGGISNSIWTIEPGVNNNMAFLTNTPLIRVERLELDTEKEFIEDDQIIKLFDEEYRIILGLETDNYGNKIDLNDLIIVHPSNAENKKINFIIETGFENIYLDNSIVSGKNSGSATIKAISEDGSKEIIINIIIRERVNEIYFVDEVDEVYDSIIEVENFSSFYLFTKSNLNNPEIENIKWNISSNNFLLDKGNGLFEVNYLDLSNKVVDGFYENQVEVLITISTTDNSKVTNSLLIKIIPSSKTYTDDLISLFENDNLLNLIYDNKRLKIVDDLLIKFDTDYLVLKFNKNFFQEINLNSLNVEIIEESNNLYKLYLTKGIIENNEYLNRLNEIELTIVAENGSEEVIVLELTKSLSSNKEIESINFNDGIKDYSYTIEGSKFKITEKVPYETNFIYLDARLLDNYSSYSKSFTHQFFYCLKGEEESSDGIIQVIKTSGKEIIYFKVIAEDGSEKIYEIEYIIESSSLDTLDGLFIGEYEKENKIDFSKDTNDYHISLDFTDPLEMYLELFKLKDYEGNDITKVFININFENNYEVNSLSFNAGYGLTIIQIMVQSQYNYLNNIEEYNIYVISISRSENSEGKLNELSINNDLVLIDEEIEYFISENVEEINLAKIKAKFSLFAKLEIEYLYFEDFSTGDVYNYNTNLEIVNNGTSISVNRGGVYRLSIKVISEDESEENIYYLNIIKDASKDARFMNLLINGVNYNPNDLDLFVFDEFSNTYSLKNEIVIAYEFNEISFIGTLYKYAYYMFNGDNNIYLSDEEVKLNLNTGLNKFEIIVFAEDSFYMMNYEINIIREYNSNTEYKVEHYKQNFDGTYSLAEEEYYYDLAYKEVSANINDYLGFTFDNTISGSLLEGVIQEDGSLILKVFYKRNNYELIINYDPLVGSVVGESGLIKYDYTIKLKAESKAGYEFVAWCINGNRVSTNKDYEFKMPNNDLEIIAEFTLINYSIDYILNGGINNENNLATYTIFDLDVELFVPTKENYKFLGWYLNSDFNGNKLEKIGLADLGNLVLHARWVEEEQVNYQVIHYKENLDGRFTVFEIENYSAVNGSLVEANPKVYQGFTFSEIKSTVSGTVVVDGSLILKLYYERNTYHLIVENDNPEYGSTLLIDDMFMYEEVIELNAYPNLGYEFSGWYLDGELLSTDKSFSFVMDSIELKINAKFEIVVYNLNYYLNDGINHPNNPTNYSINDLDLYLNAPTKEGHTFVGWYLNSDFSSNTISEITEELIGNIDLYAKWVINTYKVSLIIDGQVETEIIVEFNEKVQLPQFNKLGYKLIAWFEDFEMQNPWDEDSLIVDDIKLYASYEIIEYIISYDLAGGIFIDGESNIEKYTVLSDDIYFYPLIKEGHTFIGWFDESDNEVLNIPSGSVGNLHLIAKFEIDKFEINIDIIGRGSLTALGYVIKDNKIIVEYGSSISFIVEADTDYELVDFLVDDISFGNIVEYTIDFIDKDYLIEVKFEGSEPDQLTLIEGSGFGNKIYSIDRNNEVALFLDYYLGQTAAEIRKTFINSPDRIKFYDNKDNEICDDKALGTAYIIKLFNADYSLVIDEVYVVLLGDVNGDGLINAIDANDVLRHVKLTTIITIIPYLYAANPLKATTINAQSANAILRHIKLLELLYN